MILKVTSFLEWQKSDKSVTSSITRVMLEVTFLSLLCHFKNDVAFKIIIWAKFNITSPFHYFMRNVWFHSLHISCLVVHLIFKFIIEEIWHIYNLCTILSILLKLTIGYVWPTYRRTNLTISLKKCCTKVVNISYIYIYILKK